MIPHVPAGRGSLRIPAHVNSPGGYIEPEKKGASRVSSASEGRWGPGGIYYLLSALGGAGLAGIGAAGMLRPGYMARWFGLPPDRPEDGGFVRVAAARDLGLGLSALTMLKLGMRRPLGILWATGAVIPALDATLVRLEGGKLWQVAQHAASSMILLALGSAMLRQQDD